MLAEVGGGVPRSQPIPPADPALTSIHDVRSRGDIAWFRGTPGPITPAVSPPILVPAEAQLPYKRSGLLEGTKPLARHPRPYHSSAQPVPNADPALILVDHPRVRGCVLRPRLVPRKPTLAVTLPFPQALQAQFPGKGPRLLKRPVLSKRPRYGPGPQPVPKADPALILVDVDRGRGDIVRLRLVLGKFPSAVLDPFVCIPKAQLTNKCPRLLERSELLFDGTRRTHRLRFKVSWLKNNRWQSISHGGTAD